MQQMTGQLPFRDTSLPLAERIDDLIARLSADEKIGQLSHESPAIERLGIPFYSWWGEALHGVARAGRATVFPQASGLAACFDPELVQRIGSAIGDEARAKYHAALRAGNHSQLLCLTMMSPTVNILRDPRWGRNQETYGEDPLLAGLLGAAFVRGLQGDHPHYLKTAAFAKHFAVHSGPEDGRYSFNAEVSAKDLHETYLPAFRDCVRAGVAGIMGAYNAVNGEPSCLSRTLLTDILKTQWGFQGVVISDGGGLYWARRKAESPDEEEVSRKAVADWGFAVDRSEWSKKHTAQSGHGVADDSAGVAALALANGCDLDMGTEFQNGLAQALENGLITSTQIDAALRRVLAIRFRLGMFDDGPGDPYADIPESVVNCEAHVTLAHEAAAKSVVLLKNAKQALPLDPALHSIQVGGPNAANIDSLLGSYYGQSPRMITLMEAITERIAAGTLMIYTRFCPIDGGELKKKGWKRDRGRTFDCVVAAVGLSPLNEGEAGGDPEDSQHDGDRVDIGLPGRQLELLQSLRLHGDTLVVVVFGGSPIEITWAMQHADAVLFAGYPGEQGGAAIADILFGAVNPSGRMPFTTPYSVQDLPPYSNYVLQNRTYRYSQAAALIPFGFGLSYTRFSYSDLHCDTEAVDPETGCTVHITVHNQGERAGEDIVQCYGQLVGASQPVPKRQLLGFARVHLEAGENRSMDLHIPAERCRVFQADGSARLEDCDLHLSVGGSQGDERSLALGANSNQTLTITTRKA
ncbi:MAG: glycoside hydrolase family 3 N-terminal domain-containing protein [Planctomycetota bacterium]